VNSEWVKAENIEWIKVVNGEWKEAGDGEWGVGGIRGISGVWRGHRVALK
jgi:hypothetical protein